MRNKGISDIFCDQDTIGVVQMLLDLTNGMDLSALAILLFLSFFIGYALDLIMKHHGFGVLGNMVLVSVQFLLGFYLSKSFFYGMLSANEHLIAALAFAFVSVFLLSFVKTLARKA